jgi:hypothetical protein
MTRRPLLLTLLFLSSAPNALGQPTFTDVTDPLRPLIRS